MADQSPGPLDFEALGGKLTEQEKRLREKLRPIRLKLQTLPRAELENQAKKRGVPVQRNKDDAELEDDAQLVQSVKDDAELIEAIMSDRWFCAQNEEEAKDFDQEELYKKCTAREKVPAHFRYLLGKRLATKRGEEQPPASQYGFIGAWPVPGKRFKNLEYNPEQDDHAEQALDGDKEDWNRHRHMIMELFSPRE